jgi:virginiamycin B lyase
MTHPRFAALVAAVLVGIPACSQHAAPILPSVAPAAQTAPLFAAAADALRVRFSEYALPRRYGGPIHIVASGKTLWFTEHAANAIASITQNGRIVEHPLAMRVLQADPTIDGRDPLMYGPPEEARPIPMVTVPPTGNAPYGLTVGPDKAIWFTNYNSGKNLVGRYTAAKTLQYEVTTSCCLQNIVTASTGKMWFPISNSYDSSTNAIGSIDRRGSIKLTALAYGSGPANVTVGPDGAVWFTEGAAGKIGRITPDGIVRKEFSLPNHSASPVDIVRGPDNNLWFTEWSGNKIGRMSIRGKLREFRIPTANSGAAGITVGPDKALWFCEANANKIARITTTGSIREFPIPTADSRPFFIVRGADNALWFTEYAASKIGRLKTL